MYRYSALSDEEKKEVYDKWHGLINMSQKALDSWATDEDRLLASINRQEAKEEGGIQSGYDSFHRIKRRKSKPFSEWSNDDFLNAKQEIGFNSRMLGGNPGQPVEDTDMSKWEISLRNWGHDPSLKSSPQHSKWKSWKETQTKKEARMCRQASVYNVLMAHEQNQKIRRAILASGSRADMAEMRVAFSILINSSRTASQKEVETLLNNTDSPEVKEKIGLSYLTEILKHYKEKFSGYLEREKEDFKKMKILTKKLNLELSDLADDYERREKKLGRSPLGKLITDRLKDAGSFSSTLGVIGDLLSARTPQELADLVDKEFHEMRAYFGVKRWYEYEDEADLIPDWFFSEWKNINKHIAGFPDYYYIVYHAGIAALKLYLMAFLAKTALGALGIGVIQILAGVLLYNIITGKEATDLGLRKLGISFSLVTKGVIKDIAKGFSFLKGKASEYISRGWEKFKGLFRRAAVERVNYLLQTDRQFRLAYQRV